MTHVEQRANLDAAAANLAIEIERRFADRGPRNKALAALALVVQISAEVMEERGAPSGGTAH